MGSYYSGLTSGTRTDKIETYKDKVASVEKLLAEDHK